MKKAKAQLISFKKNNNNHHFIFRACGSNVGKLPLDISSFKNEFAIFFRSSLKENYKGLHCRYKVVPDFLVTTLHPPLSTPVPASSEYNGDGNNIF